MNIMEQLRTQFLSLRRLRIQVDPHWDTRITVGRGGESRDLLVDSRALARASPILHSILGRPQDRGGWRLVDALDSCRRGSRGGSTGACTNSYHIRLPGDNVLSLLVVMHLIHGVYDQTPRTLDAKQLLNVVQVAMRYDMMRSVRLVARQWIQCIADGNIYLKLTGSQVKWMLYISWALGHERLFRESLHRLARECMVNENGHLVDVAGDVLCETEYLPNLTIYENIKTYRSQRQSIIISNCRELGLAPMGSSGGGDDTPVGLGIYKGASQALSGSHDYQIVSRLARLGALACGAASHNLVDVFLASETPPRVLSMSLAGPEHSLRGIFAANLLAHDRETMVDKFKDLIGRLDDPVKRRDVEALATHANVSSVNDGEDVFRPLPSRPWEGWRDVPEEGLLDG